MCGVMNAFPLHIDPPRIVWEIHLFLIKALGDIFLHFFFARGVVSKLSRVGEGYCISLCLFQAKSVI